MELNNPFQELYVSESVPTNHFVDLFSDCPVQPVQPLFQGGNVILMGTQGCGKTMLLSLLKPKIREAYFQQNVPFPVKGEARRFISAGLHLTKSAVCDIAQVTLGDRKKDVQQLPFYFADFLNYSIIQDLLMNIQYMGDRVDVFEKLVIKEKLPDFVAELVKQDCWFGTLNGNNTFDEICQSISSRIQVYRKWVSGNEQPGSAQNELNHTKTIIGEPILSTVDCLKQSGVIPVDVPVFIRIDQIEELHNSERVPVIELRSGFRRMLNKALGNRDQRVSYRLGTRRYGWERDNLEIEGSGARLEERRDYLLIDLDNLFRRKELGKSWLFKEFAADAFARRMKHTLNEKRKGKENRNQLAAKLLGSSPKPKERVGHFFKQKKIDYERVLGLDSISEKELWSTEWKSLFKKLYVSDPLEAVTAVAWARQTGGGRFKHKHLENPPPKGRPWNNVWWKKERMMQAVLQLAARRQQRLLWWGYEDVLALSGSNITIFIHICHEIWDLHLKEKRNRSAKNADLRKPISKLVQAVAIQNASAVWHRKLAEQPGGDVRRRFIDVLGKYLRRSLRDDKSMSYPGGNGFSLSKDELHEKHAPNEDVFKFLKESVGFGDLYEVSHTTKHKAGEPRLKYYLNPILSPAFQIPAAHTKEPLYWHIADIMDLAKEAHLPFALKEGLVEEKKAEDKNQLNLFELPPMEN